MTTREQPPRELLTALRHPYYIVAPRYVGTSAGIKALHYLCHALNRIGERAYMAIRPYHRFDAQTNPDLLTPLLTPHGVLKDFNRGLAPITVYPETIPGNPLGAPLVVRYVMNFPGLLGAASEFPAGELRYGYSSVLAASVGAPDNILFVPASDPAIFRPEPRVPRNGSCFFAGKYKYFHGGELLPVTATSTEITRERPGSPTPEQIADLFRRSEVFYCYENTALAIEAVLCECPAVFIPNRYLTEIIAARELGTDGYAWGIDPAELARAKSTVAQGRLNYLRTYDNFWAQLERFVDVTQASARATHKDRQINVSAVNQASLLDDALHLSRAAKFVLETQGWSAFFRKAAKRIVRTVLGTS